MTRCAIYVRVACVEQWDGEKVFAAQEAAGIALCRKNGWRHQVFREAGSPGTALRKLLELVRAGKLDYVFVRSFDRLSRNISQLAAIVEEIERGGARIVTAAKCGERIPADVTLLSGLAAAFRGYELSLMVQRRRWALARRRNQR